MTEKRASILIVDDEEAVRRLLHRALSREGYLCQEVANAQQAVNKLQSDAFGLVLLDIKMPGKSGVELLPEIKASFPDIAVVMATATNDIDVAVQCMKQGAYDYISKPFNLDDVILSVERVLEKKRLEIQIKEYQQHLEEKVAEQAEKIRASFLSAITALAYALEAKDKYTSGHSRRVADIAVAIAKTMNLPQEFTDKLKVAGLLHDIGKIGVMESILNKPGRLTDEEFQHIHKHSETGEHILAPVVDGEWILRFVRSHHERYNGAGYPDGLKDTEIELGARILAVADAYEAMTSERPYRKAMSDDTACSEIEHGKGTQFDPKVADAFLKSRNALKLSSLTAEGRENNG